MDVQGEADVSILNITAKIKGDAELDATAVQGDMASVFEQDEAEAAVAVADLQAIGNIVAVPDAGWGCGRGFPPIIMSISMG